MLLAAMTAVDEDALICDFAEVYHIYDYRKLPLRYAAILACGLSDDSRIKMAVSGNAVPTGVFLQAMTVDALNLLVWSKTKDAQRNRNRPKSIANIITRKQTSDIEAFATPDEFEKRRTALINEVQNGN